jgi:hypothetical protein
LEFVLDASAMKGAPVGQGQLAVLGDCLDLAPLELGQHVAGRLSVPYRTRRRSGLSEGVLDRPAAVAGERSDRADREDIDPASLALDWPSRVARAAA